MESMKIAICIALLFIALTKGVDIFESLLVRPECYQMVQPGCNEDFIDAYPALSRSFDNLTEATTHFYLFTKDNPDVPELIHKCAGNLPPDTKFDPCCRTEIFLPGYFSGVCNFAIYRELKNERLKSGCYNVILLDWMWGNLPDLVTAKKNMRIVAAQTVIVIRNLKKRYHLRAKDFILTGHSYGAHLAGYIGQQEHVAIINGLEPSGGLFTENSPLNDRLDSSDADCVHVIHTNAGQCLPAFFGVNFTCGTTDFWVNGGLFQPSCIPQTLISFLKQDLIYALINATPPGCSHLQALQYYKASMNPTDCQFIGVKYKNAKSFKRGRFWNCGVNGERCLVMGAYSCDCAKGRTGNYYLNTGINCPYCDNSGLNVDCVTCGTTSPSRDPDKQCKC